MGFVNEYISKEDFKKYDFERLNMRPRGGMDTSTSWTINREEDIWLRKFYTESDHTAPTGGFTGISAWDFYWKGTLLLVKVKTLSLIGGGVGQPCHLRRKLLSLDIPTALENERAQVIKDLESAFTAYKDGGVLSQSSDFFFSLES